MPPAAAWLVASFGLLAGCQASASELRLLASGVSAEPQESRSASVAAPSGIVVAREVRDGCPGICTDLVVRTDEGSFDHVTVLGGVIGDRARVVGGQLPPRVGDSIALIPVGVVPATDARILP